jgi:hypothetical protein
MTTSIPPHLRFLATPRTKGCPASLPSRYFRQILRPSSLISAVSQVQAAAPGEEKGPDPQSVNAELQGACDGTQSMGLLGRHATSMASTVNNGPADLAAADDFEATYLQPLKIIDAVLEKIVDV